jgi:hypothetical protein
VCTDGKKCITRHYYDYQIKDDDMGGAHNTHGGYEIWIQNFCQNTRRKEYSGGSDVDGSQKKKLNAYKGPAL